jgi:hypothetical protein
VKIAITDACIFIDILELELTVVFFELEIEVHTSVDVINELYPDQRKVLQVFQNNRKLTAHNIIEQQRRIIQAKNYPNSLSNSDKTVLYLAETLNAIVLSSDKTVRHNAKIRAIEYHGLLWILDKLVESSLISPQEASEKLKTLVKKNNIYQNNARLVHEMIKRLVKWEKFK